MRRGDRDVEDTGCEIGKQVRFELIYRPHVRESGKLIRIFSFVESVNLGFGIGNTAQGNPVSH